MKIILKISIIIILIVNIPNKCMAQDSIYRKEFISINSGIYLPSVSGFTKTYHSPCAFINGISLGFPFTNTGVFFYVKVMYFLKSGTPIIYHFEYNNGESIMYTTQEGDVDYKQLLGNIGIQYNLCFASTNILIFNGGITLVKVSERIRNSTTGSDSKGLSGYFFGVGYEKKILERLGLFSEFQYNFDFPILTMFGVNTGGANFNVGIS